MSEFSALFSLHKSVLLSFPAFPYKNARIKAAFFSLALDFFCKTVIIIHVAIARLCKGSTTDSDSVCLGSNPSRATTEPSPFMIAAGVFPTGCGSAW